MARNLPKFSLRGIALGALLCGASPALIIAARASDDPLAAASATVTTDAKAVGVAVKRDAKVVAD